MMKIFTLFFAILIFSISFNNKLSANPQDSCLKVYYLEDSTFTNPDFVKVDSCAESPTYGEYYGKEFFRLEFKYNIIPRNYLAPKDTIIEYTWQDILPEYSEAINEFQNLENQFGTFYFRENVPDAADTTEFYKRVLLLRFEDYVNIDSAENTLQQINCIGKSPFTGWWGILVSINDSEIVANSAIYPNPASDFINISVNSDTELLTREVQILDLLGIVVSKSEIQNSNNRIDISDLSRGTYFIKIGNEIKKFVKM